MNSSTLDLTVFVILSAALTGVSTAQLQPDIDPINIAGQYFATLVANVPVEVLQKLAAVFQATSDPTAAAALILADPTLGPVARNIMKMWLLGSWYDLDNPGNSTVISAQAYKESLIWKVMQSHPMGYSMSAFGYWAAQPAAFDQYIQLTTPAIANPAY